MNDTNLRIRGEAKPKDKKNNSVTVPQFCAEAFTRAKQEISDIVEQFKVDTNAMNADKAFSRASRPGVIGYDEPYRII